MVKLSQDNLDLDQAQKILDRDHYDLEKVKRRLIEYLAVRKLNPQEHVHSLLSWSARVLARPALVSRLPTRSVENLCG